MVPTKAEKLRLQRRREGVSQKEAAEQYQVSLPTYRQWEQTGEGAPQVKLGALKKHEKCWLARVQAGVSQQAMAETIGCCRWWITRMEQGLEDCARLAAHWEV